MMAYIDSWIGAASALFSQALAGEPQLVESPGSPPETGSFAFAATLGGEQEGEFTVFIDHSALATPLMGEGVDQKSAWGELLREVAESAAGDILAKTGRKCRVEKFREVSGVTGPEGAGAKPKISRSFLLKTRDRVWTLLVCDEVFATQPAQKDAAPVFTAPPPPPPPVSPAPADHAGLDLLLDVELEATLRFGCRELPLGQVLDLGPGDVVQLDRTVDDPVDLVVGDKIVAKGQVVLVNGNFALRVTEVAAPRKRLESIRCLF